jgi:DNA-binding winged helix-turn-helix (wHTH) protein/Tfp pilus assembly protein PilF
MITTNEPVEDANVLPDTERHTIYIIGDWTLNTNTNQLLKDGRAVELEHRLTSLLVYLLQNKEQVLTREEILKAVWQKKVVNDDSIAVAISQLRKAFDDNPRTPKYIKTIPGVGYQFIFQPAAPDRALMAKLTAKTISSYFNYILLGFLVVLICSAVYIAANYYRVKKNPVHHPITPSLSTADTRLLERANQLGAGWKEEDLRPAIKLYRQIIQQNPAIAQAYLGLAEAKIKLLGDKMAEADNYQELTALLERALVLDPKLARVHLWLAELIFVHDLKPVEAEEHFKIGVVLAPQDDLIHYRYAHFLFIYKRFSEAREQINISRNLNPLSFSNTSLVWVDLLQGNNELAARELNRIESTEEADIFFKVAAQNVYYQMGDEQKAYANMQWFFKKAQFGEEKIGRLDQAFAQGGLKSVYQWLLDHKETADVGQYTPPISWARYAVAVGDKKSAINYLEQAFARRQPHVECAVADPRYAPLKEEVKFKEFLAKFGSSVAH